jgi:hypothetical protein
MEETGMIKRKKLLLSLLVLAVVGLVWLLYTASLWPKVEVGKVIEKEVMQTAGPQPKTIYLVKMSLCKNGKVKTYYLTNRGDYDRLKDNLPVKFELERFGSKKIKKLLDY